MRGLYVVFSSVCAIVSHITKISPSRLLPEVKTTRNTNNIKLQRLQKYVSAWTEGSIVRICMSQDCYGIRVYMDKARCQHNK